MPTIRTIRLGDDPEYGAQENPFDLHGSNMEEGLALAQQHIDQYGGLENPANWKDIRDNNGVAEDSRSWWDKNNWWAIPAIAVGAGAAAPAIGGAFGGGAAAGGGASAGASSVLPSASIAGLETAVPAAITSQGVSAGIGAAGAAGAGSAAASAATSPYVVDSVPLGSGGSAAGAGAGMDPMTKYMLTQFGSSLISSLLGGDEDDDEFDSFRGTGTMSDPVDLLQRATSATHRLGAGLGNKKAPRLRSSYVQAGPAPVTIGGLQIGGGLGRDPALDDPSLLEGNSISDVLGFDPFQGVAQTQFAAGPGSQSGRTAQPRSRLRRNNG
jgi:hypothetical protein